MKSRPVKHYLRIISLWDAYATCFCGAWLYQRTGHVMKREIEKEHARHVRLMRRDERHLLKGGGR